MTDGFSAVRFDFFAGVVWSWSWNCGLKQPLQLTVPWGGLLACEVWVAPLYFLFADAPKTQVVSPVYKM